MKLLASLASLLLMAGCSQHFHTLRITSEPSGQLVEDCQYEEDSLFGSGEWKIVTNQGWSGIDQKRTPYEVTMPGDTKAVIVTVGGQTKRISFEHGVVQASAFCEPLLGIPLFQVKTHDYLPEKSVHFDVAPVTTWK